MEANGQTTENDHREWQHRRILEKTFPEILQKPDGSRCASTCSEARSLFNVASEADDPGVLTATMPPTRLSLRALEKFFKSGEWAEVRSVNQQLSDREEHAREAGRISVISAGARSMRQRAFRARMAESTREKRACHIFAQSVRARDCPPPFLPGTGRSSEGRRVMSLLLRNRAASARLSHWLTERESDRDGLSTGSGRESRCRTLILP